MSVDIKFVKECVEKHRSLLLDTSKRNNLISFKHSERSRQHIRVIDELPDFLYGELLSGKRLTLRPLPEKGQVPHDEKKPEFLIRLEQAKLTDEAYIEAVDNVNEDEESSLDTIKHIELKLRNNIREELGLPLRKEQENRTNADVAKEHDLNPSYDMPEPTPGNQDDEKRHIDNFIQTLLKPEEMTRKLSGLNSYVRSDIEETGVNTLYIAFGFLQWYEAENSDKPCISPLLLLQLEIEKKQSKEGYTYNIQVTGEEPEINLSLSERLKTYFGIKLSEFTEEDGPETYMAKVNELIKGANTIPKREKWRVRRFITIGRFRFARLVMFHDLSEKKWPDGTSVSTNTIVQNLFAVSEKESDGVHAEDYDIDTPEVEKDVPLLITSADASQHSALVDVMRGKNLTIKGPPGTGKSQTITNIIANALRKEKTILFLAEKMAALNVVHERLSKANLGPYCLELHKAKKTEIFKSLEERLKLSSSQKNDGHLPSKIQDFNRYKDHITEYINVLNSRFGRQNKTIHDYLWTTLLRKDKIDDLLFAISQAKIPFEEANLTKSELTAHVDDLETIVNLKKDVKRDTNNNGRHPWDFVRDFILAPSHQDELKQLIDSWKNRLETIQETLHSFEKRFDFSLDLNTKTLESFLDNTHTLALWAVDDIDKSLIAKLDTLNKAKTLVDFVAGIHAYGLAQQEIKSLNDVDTAIQKIEELKQDAITAHNLGIGNFSSLNIRDELETLKEESTLWEKNIKTLLRIGAHFHISQNEGIDKIYALAEIPDYIASIPRDDLLFRTRDIIDETNTERLKSASDDQWRICSLIKNQDMEFDLSMMGQPHEIRMHASILGKAGVFSFFNSSYRQAKKLYMLASRQRRKFKADKAATILRKIADTKEEHQKIEQDTMLQKICGASFNGLDTDFEKLQRINEWARDVRTRYVAGDELTRNIRQWLLTAEMEELDSVRTLTEDDSFNALKIKISDIRNNISSDMTVMQYLDNLVNKVEKISQLQVSLQGIAANSEVTFNDINEDLLHLRNVAKTKKAIEDNQTIEHIFGDDYAGVNTNIQNIEKTTRFVTDFLSVSEIKDSLEIFFNNDFKTHWYDFIDTRDKIKEQHRTLKEQASQTQIHSKMYFDSESWESIPYCDLIALFKNALDRRDSLSYWISFHAHLHKAEQDIKGKLLSIYDKEKLDFETLPLAFEYIVYSALVREIYQRYPVISETSGMSLEQARSKIKNLDQDIMELQKQELYNKLANIKPLTGNGSGKRSEWTEDALIHNEINKKRSYIPIRDLMTRAGQSIQKIKPCFLMSPLTVAQYLEPGQLTFDLVVIDEASQMRPEDALGGIARAKQIVVVGDPQQLPPTPFFQSASNSDDEEEDFSSEAIMDMALSSFRPSRILSRHYRSQHESLIAFSNYHFYEKSLVLFPSPIKNPHELGIRMEYVGGTYASTSNRDEVQAVVKATLNFMRTHPDRSLGIATMNLVQKELIELEMDRAFIDHPHAAKYRAEWQNTLESFFVKNLENVQGDERDAIFISTVYGPDKNGVVMQRFGPINNAGGHRRLNVLFTRAKKNMVVFTSLKPEDIKILNSSSQGIRALKGFLSYASKGVIDEGEETHLEPDSDFEIWVKEKLETIGCEVIPQVGVAKYRIDLGVKHPKYRYGYLMGVECDGATYHSSKSVRERDVIRQQVLEGLGWRIYRIWSTDWFSNPVKEFEKLKNYIEELLKSEDLYSPTTDRVVTEQDYILEEKEEPEDVPQEDENQKKPGNENVVQLFDQVTYFVIDSDGKKKKCSVQIVSTQGDPNMGTIAQHSPIGRALLGAYSGEEIECTLPIGEVTIDILNIDKHVT